MSVIILDLASPEVNRGSYCYTPYLLYSAIKSTRPDTYLYENFTINDLDGLENRSDIDLLYVSLWSYPQIDLALALHRLCRKPMQFFGYEPLIKKLGLPIYPLNRQTILQGMTEYPNYLAQNTFRHVLLSDCDLHLRSNQQENNGVKAYPMFTSYGCPRGCVFCSASKNTNHQRYVLDLNDVIRGIDTLMNAGVKAIHFTDEDFFYDPDRAYIILQHCYAHNPDFQIIALGHAKTFLNFYQRMFKNNRLMPELQCLKLVEIGLETADDAQARKMGKASSLSAGEWQTIAENELCKVLWLTMTFYPGDNIRAMNLTGQFLCKYGLNPVDLCDRIATNGTEAGLGQFYQYYDGCGDKSAIYNSGMVLTDRPMRLLPSYLPNSFLSDIILVNPENENREIEAVTWAQINHVPIETMKYVWDELHTNVGEIKMVSDFIYNRPYVQKCQNAIALAILARLNMIRSVK